MGTRLCPDMVLPGCLAVAEKLVSCLVLPFQAGAVLSRRAGLGCQAWLSVRGMRQVLFRNNQALPDFQGQFLAGGDGFGK